MYRGYSIGVVVPAYNEALLIERTLVTMPRCVDKIIVVDDSSVDQTAEIAARIGREDKRIVLLQHQRNGGVGAAISTGYVWCRENGIEVAAVMAGDGQMLPDELPSLLDPVISGRADYAKGNRFSSKLAKQRIPKLRYLGNAALSLATRVVSGYWHVDDSQAGYTALGRRALETLPIENIYPRYGMPNDFLVTLNIHNMRVVDVPVTPVYGIGEKSGIRVGTALISYSFLLARLLMRRLVWKYSPKRLWGSSPLTQSASSVRDPD